jgi:hypothetical protein
VTTDFLASFEALELGEYWSVCVEGVEEGFLTFLANILSITHIIK